MRQSSDEELIRALGDGDEAALRILVDRHTPSIYRFSVRYTGDESLAQDISQEVFLRLYRCARKYIPGMPFKTWLFTIVRNTSIDMARSYTYRKAYSLEEHAHEAENRSPLDASPNPEERYLSKESAQRIARSVQSLPENQRTAVILKYYEDMATKEIAEVMETTVSSVESLLVRAKRNLVKLLEL
jgi:RNA polymerase sigma-70 factor (ECF subfamily)